MLTAELGTQMFLLYPSGTLIRESGRSRWSEGMWGCLVGTLEKQPFDYDVTVIRPTYYLIYNVRA